MMKFLLSLILLGTLVALTTVQSKTIYNEQGELVEEPQRDETSVEKAPELNEDSATENDETDSQKRVYYPQPRTLPCGGYFYNSYWKICCCGKVYPRKKSFKCCGYQYYNTLSSQCCPFSTVRPRWAGCARSKI